MFRKIGRVALTGAVAASLGGCAWGVDRTEGMNLYAQGRTAEAVPLLQREVAEGNVQARYSLGLAYRDGVGVPRDLREAEILFTGAAIGGDPRAVTALRAMLQEVNRCEMDSELRGHWGGLGTMHRNLITGVVELHNSPPWMLRRMAEIYETPCPGAPVQEQAAKSLRALAGGPRHIWIYVPG